MNTVTSIPITGTAVQIADGRARRRFAFKRSIKYFSWQMPWFRGSTPTEVKAKLGV